MLKNIDGVTRRIVGIARVDLDSSSRTASEQYSTGDDADEKHRDKDDDNNFHEAASLRGPLCFSDNYGAREDLERVR